MRQLIAALLWLLLALVLPAAAEDRITRFVSDVTVNTDASLTVRETITFQVDNTAINHGINRDFPTTYVDRHGQRVRVGFEVVEVRRDGKPEPFEVSGYGNGMRVKIGSADIWIPRGETTYDIVYRTTRQIGFFEDYDEVYWNATGNGWEFAIDGVTAIVRLPVGARIVQHAEYTGAQGSTGNQSQVMNAAGNEYRAQTTAPLGWYEGFTVAVAWQKGIVAAPSESEKFGWWLSDNAGIFGLLATLVAAFGYYYYAWNRVGRDPPKGTIIPLFRPPEGLGPAGVRYVVKQSFDDRSFAAAVVGLAVAGRLKINEDDDGEFSLTKLDGGRTAIAAAEQALLARLPTGTLVLKQSNHGQVRPVRAALAEILKKTYDGTAFLRNLGWFWKGAALSVAGLVVSALLMPAEEGLLGLFGVAWTAIWWGVILGVGWGMIKGLISARGILGKIGRLIPLLFLIPFMGAGVGAPALMAFGAGSPGLYTLLGIGALLATMNIVFFNLLRAPTVEGRKLLDQIEGFRMYLSTAEEDRLNALHPPEKTPELFERYLPYALALDCENEWNAKFATVLAAAAAGAAGPSWYSGRHWDAGRTGGFTDSLGSSLSSSISSASTAPGSSSGSGGGGSSGGGGGGGGGSGW